MRATLLVFTKSFSKTRDGAKLSSRFSSSEATTIISLDSVSTKCPPCLVHSSLSTGLMDYARGWAWQQSVLSRRLDLRRNQSDNNQEPPQQHDDADSVLLFSHHPVYTLGRGADESHLTFLQDDCENRQRLARSNRGVGSARLSVNRQVELTLQSRPLQQAIALLSDIAVPVMAPNGVPIYRVERGGEVTFHGPGQLVVYPLFDLRRHPFQQDLHWYLRMIEEVVIRTCAEYDIDASRDDHHTGVWVDDAKIAAVGVTASKWITTHGFALNIHPDLSYFDTTNILPCGIEGKGVTSIQEIYKQRGAINESKIPTMEEVASVVLQNLQDVFGIEIQHAESLN